VRCCLSACPPVHLTAVAIVLAVVSPAAARAQVPAATTLEVNANPVKGSSLVLRWPAGNGAVQVAVYSQLGTLILRQVLSADNGTYTWDLRSHLGDDVANGMYVVIVTQAGGRRWQRRVLVAR